MRRGVYTSCAQQPGGRTQPQLWHCGTRAVGSLSYTGVRAFESVRTRGGCEGGGLVLRWRCHPATQHPVMVGTVSGGEREWWHCRRAQVVGCQPWPQA